MGDFFDKFSKVPFSQKILLLFLVLGAIFLGFYMFLFKTVQEDTIRKLSEQNELMADQAGLVTLREQVTALETAVDEASNRVGEFSFDLPNDDHIPALLDEIHATAAEIEMLEIINVRRHPYVSASDYTIIPIELGITATYNQLIEFCWALARMTRIVHVKEVIMGPTSSTQSDAVPGAAPTLSITLRMQAFFRAGG
jgi:Tfp pilus assembly protein PilO